LILVAQRFTAAITGLFLVPASAAEGHCGAQAEFFSSLFSCGGLQRHDVPPQSRSRAAKRSAGLSSRPDQEGPQECL
jgi:hypothetical protein